MKRNIMIKSKLLSQFPNLVYGMSTILGGNGGLPYFNNMSYSVGDKPENVKENRRIFFERLGFDESKLAIQQQVHGDNIEIVSAAGKNENTDGQVTNVKNVYLMVNTADCIPILIYDKTREVIAGVHSGWRGTQKKILLKAINLMQSDFNSDAKDLMVWMGPAICKDCFEVGKEVADLFDERFVSPHKNEGKYCVDLVWVNLEILNHLGVPKENVEVSELCTFEEKGYLQSYRRDREKSGRMFAVIGLK